MSRIVILSVSNPPKGNDGKPLITLRLRALLDAGLLRDAGALALKAERKNDPEFSRLRAEAILFAGMDDACSDATAERLTNSDPFWLKLRAACFALAGDTASLELTRAVLAQQPEQAAFETLLSDISDKKKTPPGVITAPDAVDVYLLQKAALLIGEDVAAKLGVPGAVLAMRDAKNPIDLRMKLAQQLVATSGLTAQDLSVLAQAQQPTKTKRAKTPPAAVARDLVRALVELHGKAERESNPVKKAAAADLAFRRGLKDGVPDLAALYFADIVMAPSPNLKSHALAIAQMFLIAGKADLAAGWYALFNASSSEDAASRALLAAELNIVAQSSSARPDGDAALLWFAKRATAADGSPKDAARAALVLQLHDALGLPMPTEASTQLAALSSAQSAGRRPPQQMLDDIAASAGKSGHQGETVLQILVAIGPTGAGDLAPDVTAKFVRTLKSIGLPVAARDLALSALLHQPLPAQIVPLQ